MALLLFIMKWISVTFIWMRCYSSMLFDKIEWAVTVERPPSQINRRSLFESIDFNAHGTRTQWDGNSFICSCFKIMKNQAFPNSLCVCVCVCVHYALKFVNSKRLRSPICERASNQTSPKNLYLRVAIFAEQVWVKSWESGSDADIKFYKVTSLQCTLQSDSFF